uniref:Uncharacterized protein n=1 Tax=Anguilla anguilla TaxID=7936 RepID=A0A0E9V984_ANGAN
MLQCHTKEIYIICNSKIKYSLQLFTTQK